MAVSTGSTLTLGSSPPISAWQTPWVLGPRMKSKMSLHSGVMTRSKRTRGCWLSGSVELRSLRPPALVPGGGCGRVGWGEIGPRGGRAAPVVQLLAVRAEGGELGAGHHLG